MKAQSAKEKGRRLTVLVAEALAAPFQLTIEAEPPTRPGTRKNGVVWVPEGAGADLRVRRSGVPGPDVGLVTSNAQHRISIRQRPLFIECKNVESRAKKTTKAKWVEPTWSFDRMIRRGQLPGIVNQGLAQAARHTRGVEAVPILVLARNHFPPIVVLAATDAAMLPPVKGTWSFELHGTLFLPLPVLVERLVRQWNTG